MNVTDRIRPLVPSMAQRVNELLQTPDSGEEEYMEALFQAVMKDADDVGASDVHLDQEKRHACLRIRVDSVLHDVGLMPKELANRIVNHFKVIAGLNPGRTHRPEEAWVDVQVEDRTVHLRISCAPTVLGDKLCMRIFDETRLFRSLPDLGMKESQSDLIQEWLENLQGLFLVVGAVGSGKSTTLFTLLQHLQRQSRSVVSIEDPVEYRLEGVNQMEVSPERGFGFPEALKSVMRLDPDDIMLGEIRDPLSASAAMDAAATGKVLLSTLHSRDAVGTVISLQNYGVKDFEIAALLEVIVAQRLVRKLCDDCKTTRPVSTREKAWLESPGRPVPETVCAPHEGGCETCRGVGYAGRTGVFEVWRFREEDKALLLEHPSEQALRQHVRERGVPSLFDDARDLVTSGITSLEEIRPFAGGGPEQRCTEDRE